MPNNGLHPKQLLTRMTYRLYDSFVLNTRSNEMANEVVVKGKPYSTAFEFSLK